MQMRLVVMSLRMSLPESAVALTLAHAYTTPYQ